MKNLEQWLDEYGESHQNKTNKNIHWVAIPLITWSTLALLWSIPVFAGINLAMVLVVVAIIFYARISKTIAIMMMLITIMMLASFWLHQTLIDWGLWISAVVIFVGAWIAQFIGHLIEGKKPSFFKDIQFLLIGPAWLCAALIGKR